MRTRSLSSAELTTLEDIARSDEDNGKMFMRNSANRKMIENLRKRALINVERYSKVNIFGKFIQVKVTKKGREYLRNEMHGVV